MQRRTGCTEHSRHVQSRHRRVVDNTRHPGHDLTIGRDKGRHCFARFPRDIRDTGDELVERKHERAHRRTTDQILIETVTDLHVPTVISTLSSTSRFFPGRQAAANALASQALETSCECMNSQ